MCRSTRRAGAASLNGTIQLWPIAGDGDDGAARGAVDGQSRTRCSVVDDVDRAPVASVGPRIEHASAFPQRVNAGFMQVLDRHRIRLRVWERGAGETLACGTGACAAVVAGIRRGLLQSPVSVTTRGGALTIEWQGQAVLMTGPAVNVFKGEIDL